MKSTKLCSINYHARELSEAALLEFWGPDGRDAHIEAMVRAKAEIDKLYDEYMAEKDAK